MSCSNFPYRLEKYSLDKLSDFSDALPKLFDREIDGFLVRNFFTQEEIDALLDSINHVTAMIPEESYGQGESPYPFVLSLLDRTQLTDENREALFRRRVVAVENNLTVDVVGRLLSTFTILNQRCGVKSLGNV